ncbi:MAG: alpha/beta hydrolase fold domain-containing protein [Victivallales bacterium]|nr:alpha/beta hydrolase fold domain-containing protein [Victivallales bacterium]
MRTLALSVLFFALHLPAQPARNGMFQRWDKNRDGSLTRDELPERIRGNFGRVDANEDGKITLGEHQAFLRKRAGNRPQQNRMPAQLRGAIQAHLDLPYANDDNPRHRLDLYVPKEPKGNDPLPVLVYIHGGGWKNGDKNGGGRRVAEFVASGKYAGASIGYRLTGEAKWPAQLHDCKAGIRWLKANAGKYNIDPERIAVWGTSAGGHLVSMLGVTNGREDMEGTLGEHLAQDSQVACVLDWYGPSNLFTIHEQRGRVQKQSPESLLIGGYAKDVPEMGRSASPITHVTARCPPFLIAHGDRDGTVPFAQSVEFVEAMRKAGVDPAPVLLQFEGAGHGKGIGGPDLTRIMTTFLDLHLRGQEAELKSAKLPSFQPKR